MVTTKNLCYYTDVKRDNMMNDHASKKLLPENIKKLQPYVAGKTIAEVQQAYHPKQISKLASNENRLGCSPAVKPAVMKALNAIQDYPDPISRKLRARLAKKNNVEPENIIVAAGSESVIANLCRTFFCEGEEAITADATFVGFFVQANIRGIKLKKVPVTPRYKYDLDAIVQAITKHTKMIYIANPNNPTGAYVTKQEFEAFMTKVPEDILIIMDEAYFEFAETVDDYPHALDYRYPNVLSLRTFSKAYGLAGLRVGYAVGPEQLIASMLKTKLTFEPTTLAQAAALAALEDQDFLERSRKMVAQSKERLYHFLDGQNVGYVPSVSNSVLMILESEATAKMLTQQLLEEGVILRHTNAFGLPHCIRITVGTEREMQHFEDSFLKIKAR